MMMASDEPNSAAHQEKVLLAMMLILLFAIAAKACNSEGKSNISYPVAVLFSTSFAKSLSFVITWHLANFLTHFYSSQRPNETWNPSNSLRPGCVRSQENCSRDQPDGEPLLMFWSGRLKLSV